jgi:hypothetical protein
MQTPALVVLLSMDLSNVIITSTIMLPVKVVSVIG